MNQFISKIFSIRNSLIVCFSISVVILLLFDGTGKEADSIEHYLFAKYSFKHPELLLNHWAKPVFTLLASPFAQFGFIGVKLFNVFCALTSAFFIARIANALGLKYPGLASIFYFIFPLSFLTTYSGLTEPLFALFLSWSIYLIMQKKYLLSALLISFSPFIRSEGLIIIGVFLFFFLLNRKWKAMLLLASGHLILSIVGTFKYGDVLWVFNEIPYASLSSGYGEGSLFHFVEKQHKVTGLPLNILFWIGFISILIQTIKNRTYKAPLFNLILIGFLAFFIAHSLFWYFGIFHSMGLKRVFAAITPLMAIITLLGFNQFSFFKSHLKNQLVLGSLLIIIFIFPFTSNHAAVEWKKLNLSQAQITAMKAVNYIQSENLENRRFIYADPYLGELLVIDPYDGSQRQILSSKMLRRLKNGDLIIWDNWHSIIDFGINLDDLTNIKELKELKRIQDGESIYIIFSKNL